MRHRTIQYNFLTLSYVIFLVNRNTFPEFSQILSQHFLTFNSTPVVNYPNQASFERNRVLSFAFSFQPTYGIVSAGPSGHLKQSVQKTFFETRANSTLWTSLYPTKLLHNGATKIYTKSLLVETVLLFRRRLNSDQYRKHMEKPLNIKKLWTTHADRRRAGPPAFRRKYCHKHNATLSIPRWPGIFSECFPSFFRRHGGGAPLASMSKFILGDFGTIFHDLENWPYNSPKILHAAPNR